MLENSFELYYHYAETNWWFVGKWLIIKSLLDEVSPIASKPRILDIGCGTGEVMKRLQGRGLTVGIDMSMEALTYSSFRGCEALVQGDTFKLPFKDESFDILIILDLFEHLEDDISAARMFTRLLKKGGHMVVTAPALYCLWSKRDVELHHFRRYTRHEMETLLENAGMRVKRSVLRNFFLFPIVWTKYTWEKLRRHEPEIKYDLVVVPRIVNWLLILVLKIETRLLKHLYLPAGSSVVCLAERIR
ncbi:methyltransferase domain-containing protein [bacterium]|nr:methyltransferase domain-containing protein [candidate division CSSED10-310 bacterium]